jgi:hypothetical protein
VCANPGAQETVEVLMSQGETTPWGTFDEIGRPHYLYLHNGVVFQATVGNLNGIYAAWLQPGTSNRLMYNIVSSFPLFALRSRARPPTVRSFAATPWRPLAERERERERDRERPTPSCGLPPCR